MADAMVVSVGPRAVVGGRPGGLTFGKKAVAAPGWIRGAATARPDLVSPASIAPADFDLPRRQISLAAFSTPVGHFGNFGRNVLTGPSAYNWDFSLFKNFKVLEKQQVQFRAEMFNIFNTPQFSNPGSTKSATTTFGQSLSTIPAVGGFGSNRQIQFALRYGF